MTERQRSWIVGLTVIGIFIALGVIALINMQQVRDCIAALSC